MAARLKTAIITPILYGMFQKGKLPKFTRKWLARKSPEERDYYEKMMDMFGMNNTRMSFVKKESIRNQFYSDLVTPLEAGISVPGTTVHCFFAAKMGEKYLDRYKHHFKAADIRHHDMQHEELLICHPKQWMEEIKSCCSQRTRGLEYGQA